MSSVAKGFTKSLAMTVLSEIGDKTFFAAAILAMRHPRGLVLSGCLSASIVMTAFSAVVGWAAPNLLSRTWTHHMSTLLFLGFGLWSLWDGFHDKGEAEELAEVEAKLDAGWKANAGTNKEGNEDDDTLKKDRRPFLSQFFSPILLKAFSLTFFGEWGDKSQIATIGLAADENPFGVVLGGIGGQALCTTLAVLGGKSLASQISERMVGTRKIAGLFILALFLVVQETKPTLCPVPGCTLGWSCFHCVWHPISPFKSESMISQVLFIAKKILSSVFRIVSNDFGTPHDPRKIFLQKKLEGQR